MKDIVVDGRLLKVFVLLETEDRLVYIPLNAIHEVDYFRLCEIEKSAGKRPMLDFMKTYKLPDNGRNALTQYDSLIQVLDKADERKGKRIRKPTETFFKKETAPVLAPEPKPQARPLEISNVEVQELNQTPEVKVRKKPGRKPRTAQDQE